MTTELYKDTRTESVRLNDKRSCTVIALSIATSEHYHDAYAAMELTGRKHGNGANTYQVAQALDILGIDYTWHKFPRQPSGSQWTPISFAKAHPKGRYMIRKRGHIMACIDGVIHDWATGRKFRITDVFEVRL